MDRYTSPETSRLLAEAGLEQYEEDHELTRSWWGRYEGDGEELLWSTWKPGYSLALDLTDVLNEIRLLDTNDYALVLTTFQSGAASCAIGPTSRWSDDGAVEAAALVLLALLREREK